MSLRLRLLLAFAYGFLLIVIALEVPLALNLRRRVDAEVRNDAAGQAHIVAAQASGSMSRPLQLRRIANQAASQLGARVIVVDSAGMLRADSAGSPRRSFASRPEIRIALTGRTAQGTRHSDTLGEDLLYSAVPVTDAGRVAGAVRVTQSVGSVHDRVRRSVLALAAIGAAALGLGLVLAWFLADSLSRPLRKLAATARRVEEGDLDARAEVTGATEQREVTIAFNDMTERIGTVLAAQREFVSNASHQLRTPLTGLRLRLESAAAKADSPELERELTAAEQEVDRLARLLNTLLMLAREGQTRVTGRLVSLGLASKHAHERWEARSEQLGQRLRARAGRGRGRARGRGRPRDHPRQPDRERAPLLARGELGRDRVRPRGRRRLSRRARRRARGSPPARRRPCSSASGAAARARAPRARASGSRSSRRSRSAGAVGRA